jgi:hypothetical protein
MGRINITSSIGLWLPLESSTEEANVPYEDLPMCWSLQSEGGRLETSRSGKRVLLGGGEIL